MRKILFTLFFLSLASSSYAENWVLYKSSFMTGDGLEIPSAYIDKESINSPSRGIVQAWERLVSRGNEHSVRSLVEIDCPGRMVRVIKAFIDERPSKTLLMNWEYIRSDFNEIRYDAWCSKIK